MSKRIGVLAMQGAYYKHLEMLENIGAEGIEIRKGEQLESVDGLIIPGGESTVIAKLLVKNNMIDILIGRIKSGMALFGTCAGMILMAKTIEESSQPVLGLMDITVKRNAYGRQKESFDATFPVKDLGYEPFHGIFIRAPKVVSHAGNVEVLANYDGVPVLLKSGRLLASSFHPELTDDPRIHRLFLSMI